MIISALSSLNTEGQQSLKSLIVFIYVTLVLLVLPSIQNTLLVYDLKTSGLKGKANFMHFSLNIPKCILCHLVVCS